MTVDGVLKRRKSSFVRQGCLRARGQLGWGPSASTAGSQGPVPVTLEGVSVRRATPGRRGRGPTGLAAVRGAHPHPLGPRAASMGRVLHTLALPWGPGCRRSCWFSPGEARLVCSGTTCRCCPFPNTSREVHEHTWGCTQVTPRRPDEPSQIQHPRPRSRHPPHPPHHYRGGYCKRREAPCAG